MRGSYWAGRSATIPCSSVAVGFSRRPVILFHPLLAKDPVTDGELVIVSAVTQVPSRLKGFP